MDTEEFWDEDYNENEDGDYEPTDEEMNEDVDDVDDVEMEFEDALERQAVEDDDEGPQTVVINVGDLLAGVTHSNTKSTPPSVSKLPLIFYRQKQQSNGYKLSKKLVNSGRSSGQFWAKQSLEAG
jgi:hypothetical protein